MSMRENVHRLVEQVPASELHAAMRYLEYLRDKGEAFLKALEAAPLDDEPLTAEEIQAMEQARGEIARGETMSLEELERELEGSQ